MAIYERAWAGPTSRTISSATRVATTSGRGRGSSCSSATWPPRCSAMRMCCACSCARRRCPGDLGAWVGQVQGDRSRLRRGDPRAPRGDHPSRSGTRGRYGLADRLQRDRPLGHPRPELRVRARARRVDHDPRTCACGGRLSAQCGVLTVADAPSPSRAARSRFSRRLIQSPWPAAAAFRGGPWVRRRTRVGSSTTRRGGGGSLRWPAGSAAGQSRCSPSAGMSWLTVVSWKTSQPASSHVVKADQRDLLGDPDPRPCSALKAPSARISLAQKSAVGWDSSSSSAAACPASNRTACGARARRAVRCPARSGRRGSPPHGRVRCSWPTGRTSPRCACARARSVRRGQHRAAMVVDHADIARIASTSRLSSTNGNPRSLSASAAASRAPSWSGPPRPGSRRRAARTARSPSRSGVSTSIRSSPRCSARCSSSSTWR